MHAFSTHLGSNYHSVKEMFLQDVIFLNIFQLLGFLNFFLWASNLWFVYKETHWFAGRSNQSQQMTNQP